MIPKIIWQTYKTSYENLPHYAKETAETWQTFNPDYEYEYMSDDEMHEFVELNYGKNVLDLMLSFKVPVMKADLWRYLIVYKYGGVYADIDAKCQAPISAWVPEGYDMVLAPENGLHYAQWAFAASAGSPILKSVIDLVLERCKSIDYDMPSFVHYHTANAVFTDGIRSYLNLPDLSHDCEDMKTHFNCKCGFLQREAATYKDNEHVINNKVYCHSGDDWNMLREKAVWHHFGSTNWDDGQYQQWVYHPLAAKSRNYYDAKSKGVTYNEE